MAKGPNFETREEWLVASAEALRLIFQANGIELPEKIRVSCGWPHRSGRGSHAIGQCWARCASRAGHSEIFISPLIDDGVKVSEILAHELVHAADDCKNGHRGPFRIMALAIGLQGPMRATTAGPALKERLNAICVDLGPYPHARIDPTQERTQGTRLIKLVCNNRDHHYAVWTTRMWLDDGTPTCPKGHRMSEVSKKV